MKKIFFHISSIVIALLIAGSVHAQHLTSPAHHGIVQVPIGEEVYAYLRHLSVKGLINDFSEAELPIMEYDVVTFLEPIDTTKLSASERALRRKFLRTYNREPYDAVTIFPAQDAEPLFFEGIPTDKEKYLYRWKDDSTISDLQVHGLASLEFRERTKPTASKVVLGMLGGRFTGTLSGHVGFFMQSSDGQSFGDTTVALEDPLISKNKNYGLYSNHTFFDFTTAELSYDYDWFTAKLGREAIAFGGSYQGNNVIISPTIQVPDFVSIGAHVGAVRYQAVVASLLGEARFSDTSRNTYAFGPGSYIDAKYLALHDLTFIIGKDVELGFTDMTIFSRRFDLAYVQPFAFLKSVEHSLNDRDNTLLAAHARWRIAPGVEVRGQMLLDDIVASAIGTGYWGNKFAWQFGGMWSAPFGLEDVDIAFEHTRVEPYTYSHFNSQNTFSTSGQLLGASIGPNSLSYWGQIHWAASEKLSLELDLTLTERGENIYDSTGKLIYNAGADFELSVTNPDDGQRKYSILNGRRVNILTIDGTLGYELWRGLNLFVRGYWQSVDYLAGTPENPLEKPFGFLGIGAKALF
jgi:hypothetical protein